jgi:hypothetical protein
MTSSADLTLATLSSDPGQGPRPSNHQTVLTFTYKMLCTYNLCILAALILVLAYGLPQLLPRVR